VNAFSWVFAFALSAALVARWWLAGRQIAHVRAHRDRPPPAFAERVTREAHQGAADYTCAAVTLGRREILAEVALVVALTLGGGLAAIDGLWQSLALPGLLAGTGVVLSVVLLTAIVELPFAAYRTFGIEARFGFNRTTPRLFLVDRIKELFLALVLMTPLVLGVLWLMTRAGELWWLWGWVLWLAFTLALTWAFPVVIAPLFNRFAPLEADELRTRVEALLARTGFAASGVYVMDGSRRSRHGNAYFAGLGRGRRVVLYDTLVADLGPAELEAVLAHEIGHYQLGHLPRRIALAAAAGLAAFAALGWLAGEPWFYQGLGVPVPSPHAALVLFTLAAPPFVLFLRPLASALSRRDEYAADAFAARETAPDALVRALVRLYAENGTTLTPDPLYSTFHDSHPSAPERVARLEQGVPARVRPGG
jgi:STE24 endopeptidase